MARDTPKQTTLALGGMTCDHCVSTVETALAAVDGVMTATADLASQSARVEYDPSIADIASMEDAVAAVGYAPRPASNLVSLDPTVDSKPIEQAPAPEFGDFRVNIEGMTCASCVLSVERAALGVNGVASCQVSLTESAAQVRIDPREGAIDAVLEAINSAGYRATLEKADPAADIGGRASRPLVRRLAVSAVLTAPLLILAMSHGSLDFPGSKWLQLGLALPVVFYGGASFYAAAWNAARHGRSDMNTLIAVGTGAAMAYSVVVLLAPAWVSSGTDAPPVYFETAAAILTLVLLGRVLETRARQRTSASIQKLVALQAGTVRVRRQGSENEVSLAEVSVGDEVVVRPGERFPVDGTVIDGSGAVDESPITGESVPADKTAGSRVVSGSLNLDGFLVFRAESVGSETALSRIIEFVRHAQGSKAPAARLADRIAAVFVPIILVCALATFAAWLVTGSGDDRLRMALSNAVSVLIIACPCALGLATPAALAVGIGRAAEKGILIRDGSALEAARNVDTVVFDKTGTLTLGRFAVTDVIAVGTASTQDLTAAASAIESRSEHPIATAIAAAGRAADDAVADYRALPGAGATGRIGNDSWVFGKRDLLAKEGADLASAGTMIDRFESEGKSVVLAARNGELEGIFALRDTMRPEAPEAARDLRSRGVTTLMLSGDNKVAAKAIASEAGIEDVLAPVLPIEKSAAIERLQAEGRTVAMVGDGINDAPALAQADLGVAIGAGTDIAIESAGIILVRSDPSDVGRAIELAKRTQRAIVQNYCWAFGYNVLGVPIAAGALYPWTGLLLSPVLASAAMALSSISVLSNSLRLRRALSGHR